MRLRVFIMCSIAVACVLPVCHAQSECPVGFYCPVNSSSILPCRNGTYCPAGSSAEQACPHAQYCGSGTIAGSCLQSAISCSGDYIEYAENGQTCPTGAFLTQAYAVEGTTFNTATVSLSCKLENDYLSVCDYKNAMAWSPRFFATTSLSRRFLDPVTTRNRKVAEGYNQQGPLTWKQKTYGSTNEFSHFFGGSCPDYVIYEIENNLPTCTTDGITCGKTEFGTLELATTDTATAILHVFATTIGNASWVSIYDAITFNSSEQMSLVIPGSLHGEQHIQKIAVVIEYVDKSSMYAAFEFSATTTAVRITESASCENKYCICYHPTVPGRCADGDRCTQHPSVPCPVGIYCVGGNETACPIGTYCPVGSSVPQICHAGVYCPLGTAREQICPYTFACGKNGEVSNCASPNTTCVDGTFTPIADQLDCPENTLLVYIRVAEEIYFDNLNKFLNYMTTIVDHGHYYRYVDRFGVLTKLDTYSSYSRRITLLFNQYTKVAENYNVLLGGMYTKSCGSKPSMFPPYSTVYCPDYTIFDLQTESFSRPVDGYWCYGTHFSRVTIISSAGQYVLKTFAMYTGTEEWVLVDQAEKIGSYTVKFAEISTLGVFKPVRKFAVVFDMIYNRDSMFLMNPGVNRTCAVFAESRTCESSSECHCHTPAKVVVCPDGYRCTRFPHVLCPPGVLCINGIETVCTGGTYCPDSGMTLPLACPENHYCTGGTHIARCPNNSLSDPRSESIENCLCVPGSYLYESVLYGRECRICTDGDCLPGSWRENCTSDMDARCVLCPTDGTLFSVPRGGGAKSYSAASCKPYECVPGYSLSAGSDGACVRDVLLPTQKTLSVQAVGGSDGEAALRLQISFPADRLLATQYIDVLYVRAADSGAGSEERKFVEPCGGIWCDCVSRIEAALAHSVHSNVSRSTSALKSTCTIGLTERLRLVPRAAPGNLTLEMSSDSVTVALLQTNGTAADYNREILMQLKPALLNKQLPTACTGGSCNIRIGILTLDIAAKQLHLSSEVSAQFLFAQQYVSTADMHGHNGDGITPSGLTVHLHYIVEARMTPFYICEVVLSSYFHPVLESLTITTRDLHSLSASTSLPVASVCGNVSWFTRLIVGHDFTFLPGFLADPAQMCVVSDMGSLLRVLFPIKGTSIHDAASALFSVSVLVRGLSNSSVVARLQGSQLVSRAQTWSERSDVIVNRLIEVNASVQHDVFGAKTKYGDPETLLVTVTAGMQAQGVSIDYLAVVYFHEQKTRASAAADALTLFDVRFSKFNGRTSLVPKKATTDFVMDRYVSSGVAVRDEYTVWPGLMCQAIHTDAWLRWARQATGENDPADASAVVQSLCTMQYDKSAVVVCVTNREKYPYALLLIVASANRNTRRLLSRDRVYVHASVLEL